MEIALGSQLLRHFVTTLRYRAGKTIQDAPKNFTALSPGSDVRTPLEILAHMSDVLIFARKRLEGDDTFSGLRSVPSSWENEVERFHEALRTLDSTLDTNEPLDTDLAQRLLQGPFADAMTHVGQLAMLRRMAGAPIPGENFFAADISEQ